MLFRLLWYAKQTSIKKIYRHNSNFFEIYVSDGKVTINNNKIP